MLHIFVEESGASPSPVTAIVLLLLQRSTRPAMPLAGAAEGEVSHG